MPLPIRAGVRAAALALLREQVPQVEGRVHSARVWPIPVGAERKSLPALLVYAFRERKAPTGNLGAPSFNTTVTLAIMARAAGKREADVEAQLDEICGGIEAGLLEDPNFVSCLSSVGAIDTVIDIRGEGDLMVGEAAITIEVTWGENFEPRIPHLFTGADVRVDAIDPADPVGAYEAPAPWPQPDAPPRKSGPDGRAEWEFPVNPPLA
ncbi:hypothetical protein [Roseomonas xinghualingensis]|uniref:hypothetical protein n=1 Tax=Roseomonas xinghualingensis TaxID=2986475 RepID=UPI0021F0BB07|nr:hypothetical protein [Roseomonas sp. SXEYE001]MCV4209375.1 hypothetical protein [Roseomonas sp. SXEYE001]